MMRGAPLGPGTVEGLGPVNVFEDLDNDERVIILTKKDEWRTVARSRVTFKRKEHRGK